MAYSFTAASSQYLSTNSTPVTAAALTMVVWGASTTPTTGVTYFSLNSTTVAASNLFRIFTAATTGYLRASTSATTGGTANSEIATTPNSSVYANASAVYASASSRLIYLNGTAGSENTTSLTPSSVDTIGIGGRYDDAGNAWGSFFNGSLAEAALWNVALTADEIASLAKGFKPQRIRPQSLVFYAPLIRDLQDTRGGLAITNNNSATVADHPRVY